MKNEDKLEQIVQMPLDPEPKERLVASAPENGGALGRGAARIVKAELAVGKAGE